MGNVYKVYFSLDYKTIDKHTDILVIIKGIFISLHGISDRLLRYNLIFLLIPKSKLDLDQKRNKGNFEVYSRLVQLNFIVAQ